MNSMKKLGAIGVAVLALWCGLALDGPMTSTGLTIKTNVENGTVDESRGEASVNFVGASVDEKASTVLSPSAKMKLESKRQLARETALFKYKKWLETDGVEAKADLDRFAVENPLEFIQVSNQLLEKMPPEYVNVRKQIVGMNIDAAEDVLKQLPQIGRYSETAAEFFENAKQIVDREMMLPEFVHSEQIAKLTADQKETLAHVGQLIHRDGDFAQSTFDSKVMALQLAARLPASDERELIVKRVLQKSYGKHDDYTNQTLEQIAKQLLKSGT